MMISRLLPAILHIGRGRPHILPCFDGHSIGESTGVTPVADGTGRFHDIIPLSVLRSMFGVLIRLAGLALVGYFIWLALRPRYAVEIVMDEHGIKHHRGLSQGQEAKVLDFLREQVTPEGRLGIYVMRQPNGYLRLYFKGSIDPGTRQQIRNFFINVL